MSTANPYAKQIVDHFLSKPHGHVEDSITLCKALNIDEKNRQSVSHALSYLTRHCLITTKPITPNRKLRTGYAMQTSFYFKHAKKPMISPTYTVPNIEPLKPSLPTYIESGVEKALETSANMQPNSWTPGPRRSFWQWLKAFFK